MGAAGTRPQEGLKKSLSNDARNVQSASSRSSGQAPHGTGGSVEQVFVKNLSGRSVAINADLDEDVGDLIDQLTARGELPRIALRLTFNSQQLEPGVALCRYGVKKGSNVQSHICVAASNAPSGAVASGSNVSVASLIRRGVRSAWGGLRERRTKVQKTCTTSSSSAVGSSAASQLSELNAKGCWIEIATTIVTPFAEIEGTLECLERQWQTCKLSPKVLRNMVRVTDVQGVHAPRGGDTLSGASWRLRLGSLHPFPGVRPPQVTDIWKRLRSTTVRIELSTPEDSPLHQVGPVVNEEDELPLGMLEKDRVRELHITISLLHDSELAIDDVTVRFRAKGSDGRTKSEVCCVCLEPMVAEQMCRRLACLHCLHAGCAMTLLPDTPNCPVCRSSILPLSLASPRRDIQAVDEEADYTQRISGRSDAQSGRHGLQQGLLRAT